MAITRVSKFISVGVIALTLAPIVFGQGGGGGDGPPEERTMAPSGSRSNSASLSLSGTIISSASITPPPGAPPSDTSSSTSSSTSTGVSIATVPPSPASTSTRGTSSSMGSGSVTGSRPPPDSSGGNGSTSSSTSTGVSTATVPPSPASTSTRGTSSSMGSGSVTGSRPPPDSSGGNGSTSSSTGTGVSTATAPPRPPQASTATSATSVTSASSSGADTSTLPPPRTSSSMGSGSITGSRPPLDSSGGNSTGPPDGGGGSSGGMASSTDEIYFPWLYTDECDHYGEDAHYGVTFSGSGAAMIRQVWSTTGCPNHVNWGVDKGVDYHFPARIYPSNESIPAYPMKFGDNGTTDLSTTNGQIATLVSGVAMFSAWAKEPVTDWESTAFSTEGYTLDACGGHSTTEGWYHYHGTPGCLEEQIMVGENISMSEHSPFLGWSYDGFPMYGHLGPGGIEMRACDTDGADPVYCLDTCSGYEGVIPEIDDFTYRYYLTCGYDDSFFPMTINCFRGCCPEGIECHATVELCDDQAEVGYTDSYEPDLGYVYSQPYELEVLSGYDGDYINSSTVVNCSMFYNEDLVYTVQQYEDTFPGYNRTSWAPTSSPTSSPIGSPTSSSVGSPTSSSVGSPTSSSVESPTSSSVGSPTSSSVGSPTSSPESILIGSSTSSPTSETDASGEEGNFAPGRHSPSRALYSLAGLAVAALGVLQWAA